MWDRGSPEKVDSVEDEWRHFLVDHAQTSQRGRAEKFAFGVDRHFAVNSG